ncbi:glycosyltransferase [Massilia sp. DWR3-1-1]|uniref:glycosyltransferase n=1 Tax=Massilia sp. DWR3-1-1 TaxID=2804559 RepID=UPI003CF8FC80
MRVGILTYPMLFQRDGNLRSAVRALLAAFARRRPTALFGAVEASLVDPLRENLDDYDLIHVVGAAHGNHATVEAAAACGVPVVLTPLIAGSWRRADGVRARAADRLLAHLLGRELQTSYAQIGQALRTATLVVAQSSRERRAIIDAFLTPPARVRLVAHGVDQAWFDAEPTVFRQRSAIRGEFALMAGPLSPRHDQLGVARDLQALALPLVVVGSALQRDARYVQQLRALPAVSVLGELHGQPRLLASVFAAASMLIMPVHGEGADAGALAALAAGTAVLADPLAAEDLPDDDYAVKRRRARDWRGRRSAIVGLLEAPPLRERVRALVHAHGWDHIATALLHCYADAIALHGPTSNVFTGAAGGGKLLARAPR